MGSQLFACSVGCVSGCSSGCVIGCSSVCDISPCSLGQRMQKCIHLGIPVGARRMIPLDPVGTRGRIVYAHLEFISLRRISHSSDLHFGFRFDKSLRTAALPQAAPPLMPIARMPHHHRHRRMCRRSHCRCARRRGGRPPCREAAQTHQLSLGSLGRELRGRGRLKRLW